MATEHDQVIAEFLQDPDHAFRVSLNPAEAIALAIGGVLDPDMPGPRAAGRLSAVADWRGPDDAIGALALSIFLNADQLADELVDAAERLIRRWWKKLPLSDSQAERASAFVRDRERSDKHRASLLLWLWGAKPEEGRKLAAIIAADAEEPYAATGQRAIRILGNSLNDETRPVLRQYAERQLDPSSSSQPTSEPNPAASLYVLNHLDHVGDEEMDLVRWILTHAAEKSLPVGTDLDRFGEQLTLHQIQELVGYLSNEGQADWCADSLLPELLRIRGADLAKTVADEWWPEECLPVMAKFDWSAIGDQVYVGVLKRLHRTTNEQARREIKAAIRARCEATTGHGAHQMPRIGARTLLELCLQGRLETTDEDLVSALQGLDSDVLIDEVGRVRWKKPDRSQRLAAVLGGVDQELIHQVFDRALDQGPGAAIAFLEGAPQAALDEHGKEMVFVAGSNQEVLSRLCSLSESAAEFTVERWANQYSMSHFRALAESSRASERLESVPDAVRSYENVGPESREELLRALGPSEERLQLLLTVLGDRSNPRNPSPSQEDLVSVIGILSEHMEGVGESDPAVETLEAVCREATQLQVRNAAYRALGEATPSPRIVDLLLERRDGEVPALHPAVEGALSRLADKLELEAADESSPNRAAAISHLQRIDPDRAAVHARSLLQAPGASDRQVAAKTLGEAGSTQDADQLEEVLGHEPNADVRREIHRAIRRLRIGDLAAAHERLGELAGIDENAKWASADPRNLFDQWADPIVTGLNRIAQAVAYENWSTAIDQLNEVAKALLFRAIEVRGSSIGVKQSDIVAAASNDLEYGSVVGRQHLLDKWRWVRHLASLYELRTEHIAPKGKVEPPAERTDEDWTVAQRLFRLGAKECCNLLLDAAAPTSSQ